MHLRKYNYIPKIVSYLPRVNIVLTIVLFLDFYVLPTHDIPEKPDHEMIERSSSNRYRSYLTYSLIAKSGHKYHIPEKYERLVPTDSDFTIQRTFLFYLKRRIVCYTIYEQRRFNIGYLNTNEPVQILVLALFGISVYTVIYPDNENAKLNLIGLSILA